MHLKSVLFSLAMGMQKAQISNYFLKVKQRIFKSLHSHFQGMEALFRIITKQLQIPCHMCVFFKF